MTKKHVLLVGAGQLGSRHLQAMASCKTNIDVSVVDPSMDALRTAQERLQEVKLSSSIGKISFLQRISDVESDIDCCIIATNAQQRLTVLKELLEHHCVDNIIFVFSWHGPVTNSLRSSICGVKSVFILSN